MGAHSTPPTATHCRCWRRTGPVDALLDVVARWADAVRHLGLPAWKLVRAEVFPPEDLERQFREAKGNEISVGGPEPAPGLDGDDEISHQLLHQPFPTRSPGFSVATRSSINLNLETIGRASWPSWPRAWMASMWSTDRSVGRPGTTS